MFRRRAPSEAGTYTSLLDVISTRWPVVLGSTLVVAVAAATWSSGQPKLYEATATIAVVAADPSPAAQGLALANVRALFENQGLASAIVRKFALDQVPESLRPTQLIRDRLRVTRLRDTNNLQARLRLRSPSAATAALSAITDGVAGLNAETVEEALNEATRPISRQLEEARQSMDRAATGLLAHEKITQLDRLRRDAERALEQQRNSANDPSGTLSKLYEGELQLRKLEFEYRLASRLYSDLLREYQRTKRDTAHRSVAVKIVDAPVPPSAAVTPRIGLSAVTGAAIGMLLAIFVLAGLAYGASARLQP